MHIASDANAIFDRAAAINLSDARQKFIAAKGLWWRLTHNAEKVEREYRRLLFFIAAEVKNPLITCSRDLHDFWQAHRSDARRYSADCEMLANFKGQLPLGSARRAIGARLSDELETAAMHEQRSAREKIKHRQMSNDPGVPILFHSSAASCAGSCGCHEGHAPHGCSGHGYSGGN